MTEPTPIEAAKDRREVWSSRSVDHERAGRLSDETIAALAEAHLFGLMVPTELGGLEAGPCDLLDVFAEVSHGDAATGWVLTTGAFAAGLAGAFLGDEAAADVFGGGLPIIAGSGAPNGRARPTGDGHELTGAWRYGSGILHATHTHNGAMIVDEAGEIRADLGAQIFVTPIAAAERDDGWDVLGLAGTGSVDYRIERCRLPDGWGHPVRDPRQRRGGPAYQAGLAGLSAVAHSGFFLGAGRRLLDELAVVTREGGGRTPLGDSESFLEGFGRAEAGFRAARALVFETWREVEGVLARGGTIERSHQTLGQLALCHLAATCTEAAQFAYQVGGGVSLRNGPLQRAFRDILAGRQHIRVSPTILRACARDLLA